MAELHVIAISNECQAYGLGRMLIEHLKGVYHDIFTAVDPSLIKTQSFFLKLGF